MDIQTKKLTVFYWVLLTLVGLALLAGMNTAAAFFALVLLASQLSEIATYLKHLLLAQNSRSDDSDVP